MKYYIIAGEASGDLHGSNLMKGLYAIDKEATIRFWGGDLMQQVGGTLVKHYKERSFMGFLEVIQNISKIVKDISLCKNDIASFNPDALIFIDNSGFNLRIAKWAKKNHFQTSYYISPQVWASRASRVSAIKRDVDFMYVILPFEPDFYKSYNYEVDFVGHPLIDAIENTKLIDEVEFRSSHQLSNKPLIALLPGSRKQEVSKMLDIMLSITPDFDSFQFVIAGAPSLEYEFYQPFLTQKNVAFVSNKTYDLLRFSHAALVTSGTATLETALFKVPQVVCYKANAISYFIAKQIITLKFISLVNLIRNKEVVKELIQNDLNSKLLSEELHKILVSPKRDEILQEYEILQQDLGGKGASQKTAQLIINRIKSNT